MLNLMNVTVMESILVPIFVCVVLPIFIIWFVTRTRQHETDKKTEVMLKAIESGVQIDPEFFKTRQPRTRGIKEELLDKFTGACVTSFMGIAFLVISLVSFNNPDWIKGMWFMKTAPLAGGILLAIGAALFLSYLVGKRMLAKEIEEEEKKLQQ